MSRKLSKKQVLSELGYTYDTITVIKLKEILREWGVKGISVPKDQLVIKVADEYNRIKQSEESLSRAPGKSINRLTKKEVSPIRRPVKKTSPKVTSPAREPVYYYTQLYVVMALSKDKEPVCLGSYNKKEIAIKKIEKYMLKKENKNSKVYMEKTNMNGKMKSTASSDHEYYDIVVD